MSETRAADRQEVIAQLAELVSEKARRDFLRHHAALVDPTLVEALCGEVARLIWADRERAPEVAATARFLAEASGDERSQALARRASGNAWHFAGESAHAQEHYAAALEGFEALGDTREAAITRSSALHNLAYLGQYAQALEWAGEARSVFEQLADQTRLAILEHNVANVYFRQDRWREALERYTFAHREFSKLGRSQDAAVCLRNIAVCHISLHNFDAAYQAYEENRAYCLEQGLDRLVLELDHNIANLFYLRGEYTRAISLFRDVRRRCEAEGDEYYTAVCDLEQSEMYLELNLVDEAAALAQNAFRGLRKLARPYEAGKALVNSAVARSRLGRSDEALRELEAAREIFLAEENRLWCALIDFYRAVVLYRQQRPVEAMEHVGDAREVFLQSSLAPKAAMCELLLAELLLDLGRPTEARDVCRQALARLRELELPALEYRGFQVLGQVEEALGDQTAALTAYRHSQGRLEHLRSQLHGEDFKIAFLADKHSVYESLVWLTLETAEPGSAELAFAYIEQACSRTLADLMAFRAHALPAKEPAQGEVTSRMRTLREELNWFYRQLDLTQMDGETRLAGEFGRLHHGIVRREAELRRALREIQATDRELSSLLSGGTADLETIRQTLTPGTVLVEYFTARGTIFGCVLSAGALEIRPLTAAPRVQAIHRRLQFQLSRLALGRPAIGEKRSSAAKRLAETAIRSHLRDLHGELMAPLVPLLEAGGGAEHLVLVPHGFLHYVPFHALADGERSLIDRWSISYAPSASVYQLCATKTVAAAERSLVLGVADERAPQILDEAHTVAAALPNATLLLGTEADEAALRQHGAESRYVHIATHGLFRRDNPMFSAIQLGSSRLSLFDLYDLRLEAELVVLSGCGTGLNAVLGADELVGLTRGLLYAGAQSALVSLWDVNDASTAEFMRRFYAHLGAGLPRARALRRTMRELRQRHPNPYHWAPFILVGQPGL